MGHTTLALEGGEIIVPNLFQRVPYLKLDLEKKLVLPFVLLMVLIKELGWVLHMAPLMVLMKELCSVLLMVL